MDLISLSKIIEQRYRQYLQTSFYFKDKDLRKSFEEALASGHLSRGPFIEATPLFKKGKTPRELFQELSNISFDNAFLDSLLDDRPLYMHQEQAISKSYMNRNVIIATGTGSGKTESFLYPILLYLYKEFSLNRLGPGVRALILYPMNALANDQRERLGDICRKLKESNSPFQFTFGQYIGETPEDKNDSFRDANFHLSNRLPGELVLRSEMRETPPHILLTNYSMLEYLLLRPQDSPLFDKGQAQWWKFLVLDEVHQYRGSNGIEMAMLLRRLKQRLREGGCKNSFQCIATSATLVDADNNKPAVAKFASDLFGEQFQPDDVILGETEQIIYQGKINFSFDDYIILEKYLESNNDQYEQDVKNIASKININLDSLNEDRSIKVGELLLSDQHSNAFIELITQQPQTIQEASNIIFYDYEEQFREKALANLVNLLQKAKNPKTGASLLSARYHFFLRSLEGAYVSYWPAKKVFLDRKSIGDKNSAFEVALCRECGQHYFIAQKHFKGGKIQEAIRDPNDVNFGVTFLRPIENENPSENENSELNNINGNLLYLCMQCGIASNGVPNCGHSSYIKVLIENTPEDEDKADQLSKCGACGYTAAGRDPVREVVHGTDGPHSVIATTLFQYQPEGRKKILAFADGRQEAAFFAWYLEESYKDILNRNLILKIANSFNPLPKEGISLATLADRAFRDYRNAFKKNESADELEIRKSIWQSLYREFLTEEQRISLVGVGLVHWSIRWPEWYKIPDILLGFPWFFSESEAKDLLLILLDTMRIDKSVELLNPDGISLVWNDLNLYSQQMTFRIGDPRGDSKVRSWDGENTRRTRFLSRLLKKIQNNISEQDATENARYTLRAIWESFKQYDSSAPRTSDRLLIPINDGLRLNPNWWRLKLIENDQTLFKCDTCGQIYPISTFGLCIKSQCSGSVYPIKSNELGDNHYRILYKEELPLLMRVEEHTAQLQNEKARQFQREFKDGKINILSCSTTFELGVDLGNLDTIFLRNVPPESFNYAQRVGRAGRRSEYPGFAVTFCRRSPHDLYHFSDPIRILKGTIHPPSIKICNEKIIIRHVTAVALSYFFRYFPARFKSVKDLFKDFQNPSATKDFYAFLKQKESVIKDSLLSIVPEEISLKVGLHNHSWIERIAGKTKIDSFSIEESRFVLAEAEVASDYLGVLKFEQQSSLNRNYKAADWARKRLNTIESEDVLSFLSRKAIIPKYGFPTDVVELDTNKVQQNHEASEISLQRDLSIAIAEFAPTSKIIANKKEWISYGLKKVPEREWPLKYYKRCSKHNVFYQWGNGQPEPPSSFDDKLQTLKYIIPSFGFVTNRETLPQPPKGRSSRALTTRPYFAGALGQEKGKILIPPQHQIVQINKASPGLMVVLCEGPRSEGFYICADCGAGFREIPKNNKHKTPYGQDCKGVLQRVSLGHEFVTDVLQLQFLSKPNTDMDPMWFAFSLAYAIVEGAAEVLEVPSTDLNTTVTYGGQYNVPPIILYDNVPGGAGLVSQLEDETIFKSCMQAAYNRVLGKCGCDEGTSCYGCLRSYRNQFAHQNLKRGPVKSYLEELLSMWH